VVKAFHLSRGRVDAVQREAGVTVAMCGDDPEALRITGELVRDVGAVPAVWARCTAPSARRGRGLVIGLAFSGVDPGSAIPHVTPSLARGTPH